MPTGSLGRRGEPLHSQRAPGASQPLSAPLPGAPRTRLSPTTEKHQVSPGVSWCLLIKHELLGNGTSQLW